MQDVKTLGREMEAATRAYTQMRMRWRRAKARRRAELKAECDRLKREMDAAERVYWDARRGH